MNGAIIGYSPIDRAAEGLGHALESLFLDASSGKVFHGAHGELFLDVHALTPAFLCPRCSHSLNVGDEGHIAKGSPLLICRECGWDSTALGYRSIAQVREDARDNELEEKFRQLVRRLESVVAERERKGMKGLLRGGWTDGGSRGKGSAIEEFAKAMEEKESGMRGLQRNAGESWKGITVDEQMLGSLAWDDIAPWQKRIKACEWRIGKQPPLMNQNAEYLALKSPFSNEIVTPPKFKGSLASLQANAAHILPVFDASVKGSSIRVVVQSPAAYGFSINLISEKSEWTNCIIEDEIECTVSAFGSCEISRKLLMRRPEHEMRAGDDDCKLMFKATFAFIDAPNSHKLYSKSWSLRIHLMVPME